MKFAVFVVAILISLLWSMAQAQAPKEVLLRGEYLVKAAGCADCHTPSFDKPFAGGLRIEATLGPGLKLAFYTPNISPDTATGIGSWSEADFARALRKGVSPKGQIYYPVFPWRSYTKITDADVKAVYAYLRTSPPIVSFPPKTDLGFPIFNQRWLMWFWKTIFFSSSRSEIVNLRTGPGPFEPIDSMTTSWNRGAYLVEAVFHCAECHSPRNLAGAPIADQWMAGSNVPVGKRFPPNITPDLATGLGDWSRVDWMRFLASGLPPDGKQPSAEMAQVIQNTSRVTDADRAAMVDYLMSLAPVARKNEAAK